MVRRGRDLLAWTGNRRQGTREVTGKKRRKHRKVEQEKKNITQVKGNKKENVRRKVASGANASRTGVYLSAQRLCGFALWAVIDSGKPGHAPANTAEWQHRKERE